MTSDTESSTTTLVLTDVDIYSSTESPWEKKEIQYWELKPGSKHHVLLLHGDKRRTAPYSKVSLIIDTPETMKKYRRMYQDIYNFYDKNQDNSQALVCGQLSKGHFVVIRLSLPTHVHGEVSVDKFYRARVLKKRNGYYVVYAFDTDQLYNITVDRMYRMRREYVTLRPQVAFVYLEGLEFFEYSTTLKDLMEDEIDWDSGSYIIHVGDRKFKHHVTVKLMGARNININDEILKAIWKNRNAAPRLAKCCEGRFLGKVVNAESNGVLTFQFPFISYHMTFIHYMEEIEQIMTTSKFAPLLKEAESGDFKSKVMLDPQEIYIAPAPKNSIKIMNAYVRVVPCIKVRMKVKLHQRVSCEIIDFNGKDIFEAGALTLAKVIHKWLHQVPPQGVSARLVNVRKLDAMKFFEDTKFTSPAAVCTIPVPVPLMNTRISLPFVELYNDVKKLVMLNIAEELQPVTPELFATGIAEPFDNLISIPRELEDEQPFYYIDMEKLNAFLDPAGCGKGERQELEIGKTIYFDIASLPCHSEFTIQTVSAKEHITEFTKQLSNHLNLSWIHTVESKAYDNRDIRKGWYYAYACDIRNEILRVKLAESLQDGPLHQMKLKVLLIDYAEYEVVPVSEIRLNIPMKITEYGPQAVRVIESDFKESVDTLSGKRCSAKITSITKDNEGMTILKLSRCNVFLL